MGIPEKVPIVNEVRDMIEQAAATKSAEDKAMKRGRRKS
jgi:hypothetical protein